MAVLATTRLSLVQYNFSKLSISGFPVEQWRFDVSAGYTAGDTLVVTPSREFLIKSVVGLDSFFTNLAPITANAQGIPLAAVTLTATATLAAQTAPATIDFLLICQPR